MSHAAQTYQTPNGSSGPAIKPDARPLPWWTLVILAIISLAVFANSLKNKYTLDDVAIVEGNPHVNNLNWLDLWVDNYWPKQDGVPPDILYRPLTIWSYVATQAITPNAPGAHHLGNILLHALVTVMATVLAQRIFANRPIAIITGLLFALHPLHTEVVANIVGRAELLSAIFTLAALLVYLPTQPLLLETSPIKRSWFHGLLVALCFFLALLAKESPVALLAAFPLIDLFRWSRSTDFGLSLPRWLTRQTLRYYLPMAIAFAIYLALRYNACGVLRDPNGASPLVNPLVGASLLERLVTPFALFAKYLALTFWPATLSADYSFPSLLPTSNILAPLPLAGLLTTALALIAAIKLRRSAILITLILFACSYALVSNFLMPIGTIMGERLFYLPSLFVLMLVAAAGHYVYTIIINLPSPTGKPTNRFAAPAVAIALLAVICTAMTVRTVVRNTDWEDNINLAIATARDNPNSAKSLFWAGNVLSAPDAPPQFKDFGQVLFQRAVELYPTYGEAYFELAKGARIQQDLPLSMVYLAQAARFGPGKSQICFGIESAIADLSQQNPADYMPELMAWSAEFSGEPAPQFALALAYCAQGNLDQAEQLCMAALAADQHFHEAACQLAYVTLAKGQREQGIEILLKYVRIVRSNPTARLTLANAFLELDHNRHPRALAGAERLLIELETLAQDDPRTRELRTKIAQKRATIATDNTPSLSFANTPGGPK